MATHKVARKQRARAKPKRKAGQIAREPGILFAPIVDADTFPGLGIAGDVTRSEAVRLSSRRAESNERKSFVEPILRKIGWTINEWAVNSEVDFHSVKDYLNGNRNRTVLLVGKAGEERSDFNLATPR